MNLDKEIIEKYESIRRKIDLLKKKDGFKCFKCGSCCLGPPNPVSELDIEYMNEKGVDMDGIEIEKMKYHRIRHLKIIENNLCYYYQEESKTCKIHPYNPIICYTYPFVVNIGSGNFAFKPCLREQKIRRKFITKDLKKELRELEHLEWEEEEKKINLN